MKQTATKKQPALKATCLGIGERIRALRNERQLGIDPLAKRANLSKGNLSDIETGRRDPRCSTLHAIAKALGVSFSELVEKL
jgi:transcriptional regulator with XRE-family HTH domain